MPTEITAALVKGGDLFMTLEVDRARSGGRPPDRARIVMRSVS